MLSFELAFNQFNKSARKIFQIKSEVKEIGILPPERNEILRVWHELHVLQDPWTYPELHAKYDALEKELSEVFGFEVFFESINPAVSALYRV